MLNVATWTPVDTTRGDSSRFFGAGDERRMHVQAYRYWLARADGRPMPALRDCRDVTDAPFAARLALIELAGANGQGDIVAIGVDLEADVAPERPATRRLFEELLRLLPQVVLEQGPVGFEADFPAVASADVDYAFRGILLPIANDEGALTHVMALINYRRGDADGRFDDGLAALCGDPPA